MNFAEEDGGASITVQMNSGLDGARNFSGVVKQQMQKFSKGDIVLLKIEGNRNQYPMAKELEKMQMTGFRSKRSIVTCKFL